MDFVHPIEAVVPGVQGRVLAVLARTNAEVTISGLARLAGVSVNRATAVVNNLVTLGLVERREAGNAAQIRLARGNTAAGQIAALADLRDLVIARFRDEALLIQPTPASLVVFGSFARGDAHADSDIDVLVVRPAEVEEDDPRWLNTIGRWIDTARDIAGNPVNLIQVGVEEVPRLLRRRSLLWQAVSKDSLVVLGDDLTVVAAELRR